MAYSPNFPFPLLMRAFQTFNKTFGFALKVTLRVCQIWRTGLGITHQNATFSTRKTRDVN